jgi:type IX secretion system substrate protein
MKTLISLFVFLLMMSSSMNAQYRIKGKMVAGGTDTDYFNKFSSVVNGNIFVGCTSSSNKSRTKSENSRGSLDYWVTKLSVNSNSTFTKAWDKTIGGNNGDNLRAVVATTDGGCLLAGSSSSGMSGDKTDTASPWGKDCWLVKLNKAGNIQWQKTIYNTEYGTISPNDMDGLTDGGFIMCSGTGLTKLDSLGNIVWFQPSPPGEKYYTVKHTFDGGFIIAGDSYAYLGKFATTLTKTDSYGVEQWSKDFNYDGDGDPEYFHLGESAIQTSDGGYAIYWVLGFNDHYSDNYLDYIELYKLDTAGNTIWYAKDEHTTAFNYAALAETTDGGFLLGSSWGGYSVRKLDKNGNMIWEEKTPRSDSLAYYYTYDELRSIVRISPQSYLLGGTAYNYLDDEYNNYLNDVYVVGITDTTGRNSMLSNFVDNNASKINSTDFKVYPNPAKDKLFIQSQKLATFILADASGKIFLTMNVNGNYTADVSQLSAGIYYLRNTNSNKSEKIIVVK